jgi:DNA-binding NtrC family response regulator
MPVGRVPQVVQPKPRPGPGAVGRETILLVEDEDSVRRFARVALERHGFRVIDAADPLQALSIVQTGEASIQLLLTDVVMPGISGPELAERLRKIIPGLRVLYMSGYPAGLAAQGGPLDPSVRLLSKPFTTGDLLATAKEVLDQKQ